MDYATLKALHLISVVSWFAGLFYLVRLFVYAVEARDREEPARSILTAQLSVMQLRLWRGITVPAATLTAIFGFWLMALVRAWEQPWFHLKLLLLAGLYGYHFHCGRIRKRLAAGQPTLSSRALRQYNELATLFLVSIISLVVTKSLSAPLYFAGGFLAFGLGVFGVIALLRRRHPQRG